MFEASVRMGCATLLSKKKILLLIICIASWSFRKRLSISNMLIQKLNNRSLVP